MKLFKKALPLLIIFPLLSGCKDFLEEKPYSFVGTENFFKTAADAELALTGVYEILNASSVQGQGNHHMWGRAMHYLTAIGNDELIADNTASEVDYIAYSNYTFTPQTPTASFTWIFLYAGINRANYLIENIPAISMDPSRKTEILAEARFLRGLYYFYLGWMWGGVPVTTTTKVELDSPRNSIKEVMEQAEADFKFAYENLPMPKYLQAENKWETWNSANPGRTTKYAAAGFLVKLYLFLGSCKEYNVGANFNFPLNSFDWVNKDEMYNKAGLYCNEIILNGKYKLIENYSNLFLAATEADARQELMICVQAGIGGQAEYILSAYLSGPKGNVTTNGGTYGRLRPLKDLYNKYILEDPRRAWNMTGSLNTTTNSTMVNGLKYFTPDAVNVSFSNLNLGKYREASPDSKTSRGIPNWAGETDFGILRYADVLLMDAELKYKRGDLSGAQMQLDSIRYRAAKKDDLKLSAMKSAYSLAAGGDFMQELLDERSRELCGEGWRRFDLVRTNRLKSVVSNLLATGSTMNTQNVPQIKQNFEDHEIWYPIPAREIELNPNLEQNPEYPR